MKSQAQVPAYLNGHKVAHYWETGAGVAWAVVWFGDTPYLACERDV